jgi:hypothetical protein
MDRHRQQCHQATSEGQIADAPLSLIAVQPRNLMVAHSVLAQPFMSHSAVSQGNVARSKEARCGVVAGGLQHPILAIE